MEGKVDDNQHIGATSSTDAALVGAQTIDADSVSSCIEPSSQEEDEEEVMVEEEEEQEEHEEEKEEEVEDYKSIKDELLLSLQKEQELIQTYKDLLCEEQAMQAAIQEAELNSKLSKLNNECDTIEQVKLVILS